MGQCLEPAPAITKEDTEKSRNIDKKIRQDVRLQTEYKVLLLGTGESGKSTIARQMRILYLQGFTEEERAQYRDTVYSSLLYALKVILRRLNESDFFETRKDIYELATPYLDLDSDMDIKFTKEAADLVRVLWVLEEVKECYLKCVELRASDSSSFFFNSIDRISDPEYLPNDQDLLRTRTRTTGINELCFRMNDLKIKLVDVGGQRSERKKWIHCFQDITAIIFCVAMNEYDLKLVEDENVNRMVESVKLFDEIVNCQWFHDTPVILFLNKSDLFREKIKGIDLSVCFPDYSGGCDAEKGTQYLIEVFTSLNKSMSKSIYFHVTCATDTENISHVFCDVKDVISRYTAREEML